MTYRSFLRGLAIFILGVIIGLVWLYLFVFGGNWRGW